jgi:phage FluMu protein Com
MKPILAIEENEEIPLPKKYHKINNLCAIIYDQLTELYTEENYKDLNSTVVNFKKGQSKVNELKKKKINPLEWLEENELTDDIEIIVSKQILMAVTSDFINFVFESLYTAKRGKMTIAYALLRKPITDLLFILEQLLVDRKEFIHRFYHIGEPKEYDPSNRKIDKLAIIEKAIEKIRIGNLFSGEYIYDLRYNKEFDIGFNGLTNQAIHIVTNDRNYKTEEQNLNFVFSNKENTESYFEHYYNLVPYLLIYSVSVIDEIVFEILKDSDNQKLKIVKEFRRLIAMLLSTEYIGIRTKKNNKEIFSLIKDKIKIKCPNCENINSIERADCELFFETEILLCTSCLQNILITDESIESINNFWD